MVSALAQVATFDRVGRVSYRTNLLSSRHATAHPSPKMNRSRAGSGYCTNLPLRLQAYSIDFSGKAWDSGSGDRADGSGIEAADLGLELVAVEDQDQKQATDDHGTEGDTEEGDVDVALGRLDVDTALGGGLA